ncbi:MAG TPA: DUF748 domain-containing protein [bacterium]|nr:DUF748 domain-containing protein [bacterium]
MKKRITLLILVLLVVPAILAGIIQILANPLAKKAVEARVGPLFEGRLSIGSVRISVPGRSIILRNLLLRQPPGFPPGNLLTVDEIRVQAAFAPLLRRRLVINRLLISNPEINIIQAAGGATNLEHDLGRFAVKKGGKEPPAFKFHLDGLSIRGGRVNLYSRQLSPAKEPALSVSRLGLTLGNLNFPNEERLESPFKTQAVIETVNPVPVAVRGRIVAGAGPLDFDASTEIRGVNLADFAYLYPAAPISITAGRADVRAEARCRQNDLESRQHLEIRGLKLAGSGGFFKKTLLGLPAAAAVKFLEDREGALSLDFEVKGTVNELKSDLKEAIAASFSRAFREKFGRPILAVDRLIGGAARGLGTGIGGGLRKAGKGISNLMGR